MFLLRTCCLSEFAYNFKNSIKVLNETTETFFYSVDLVGGSKLGSELLESLILIMSHLFLLQGGFMSRVFSSNLMGVNFLAFSKMNKSQDGDRPK